MSKDKVRQTNEVSTMRKQYTTMEKNLREVTELNQTHVSSILISIILFSFHRLQKGLQIDLTEQINRLNQDKLDLQQIVNQSKTELNTIQKDKDRIVQQLQTTLAQLHSKLDDRVFRSISFRSLPFVGLSL